MRIAFDGYEIEVKAKHTYEKRFSEKVTSYFLNYLAIVLHEASESNDLNGYPEVAGYRKEAGKEIYKCLKEKGFYD